MTNAIRPSTDHCIKAGIAGSKEFAKLSGITLDLDRNRFIDDQHLDPVWYGGTIGTFLMPDGWKILIVVNGDVSLTAHFDGNDVDYDNKGNNGAVGSDLLEACQDDTLFHAMNSEGRIDWRNNNWVEVSYVDPNGRFVDCSIFSDNIIETDDILSVFFHDSQLSLIEALEQFKSRYDLDTGKIKPED